jgi:hypothetical protein
MRHEDREGPLLHYSSLQQSTAVYSSLQQCHGRAVPRKRALTGLTMMYAQSACMSAHDSDRALDMDGPL